MHYEYAVDPRAITSDWKTCHLLSEKFGFDEGRLLSLFPRKWLKMAIEYVDKMEGAREKEKETMVERLKVLKDECSIPSGREYKRDKTWFKNAIDTQNGKCPFRAVISNNGNDDMEFVLNVDDVLYGEKELISNFQVDRDDNLPRDVESVTNALSVLLRASRKVLFIDPYFYLSKQGYRLFLKRSLRIIDKQKSNANSTYSCDISIHANRKHKEKNVSILDLINRHKQEIVSIIPHGMRIDFYCWEEKFGGEGFHDRFLVTDKGGISIQAGFQPMKKSKPTYANLMSSKQAKEKQKLFFPDSKAYELPEKPIRICANGKIFQLN